MSAGIRGFYNDSASNLATGQEGDLRATAARALHVNLRDPSGAYVAPGGGSTDEAAFTAGSSTFNPVGGVFNDSAAALTSGQQGTARATANRAMHVNIRDHLGNEATLTGNSLNVNVTNASSGGTASADQAAFTAGSTQGTPTMGVFNDGLTNLTSGQMGVLRITNTRSLHTTIDNASIAVTGTFWQATQPVSGTVTANIGTTNGLALDTTVSGLQVAQGSTTSGQKGGLALGAVTTAAPTYTTAQSSPLSLDTAGNLRVLIGNASLPVTQSGTWTVQPGNTANTTPWLVKGNDSTNSWTIKAASTAALATDTSLVVSLNPNTIPAVSQSGTWNIGTVTTVTTVSTLTSITNAVTVSQATAANLNAQVVGSIAAGSADSGNPVKVGGVYGSAPATALTSGNRGNILIDAQGRVCTIAAPTAWVVTQQTSITVNTETTIVTAGAAGVFNDLAQLILTNSSSTAVSVTIKDATAGTTRLIVDLAANGGAVIPFPIPHPQASAAANWTATVSSAVSTIHITAIAVQRK